MIITIKKYLEYALWFCLPLALTIEILYLGFDNSVLTNKSFDKLSVLNSEISKLHLIEDENFTSKSELFYRIYEIIDPNIFDEYYFLSNYVYTYEYINEYFPKIKELREIGVDELEIETLTNATYFDRDSLFIKIKAIASHYKFDYLGDYIDSKSYKIFFVNKLSEIIIPDATLEKLENIKNISYSSDEELEYSIQKAIGINLYDKYSDIIMAVKDRIAPWKKYLLWGYLTILGILIVSRIIIGIILFNKSEKKSKEEIESNIAIAKEQVNQEPQSIKPVWDLANYTLQKYYNKNLSQVNSIYRLSVLVMLLGFLLIVSILVATIYYKIDMKIDSVGIVAGIITEFIGATFLFIYKSTINQALQHSKSLEEMNNVGMAIKIIETIEKNDSNKENLESAKIEIAKNLINK